MTLLIIETVISYHIHYTAERCSYSEIFLSMEDKGFCNVVH